MTTDREFQAALVELSLPGIIIGHRRISAGDESALMPGEAPAFATSVVAVRRASGAARIVARECLAQLGHLNCEVPKARSGAPIWPTDIVGSLAHDAAVALAAVGRRSDVRALGIDIEPAEPLPPDLVEIVLTPRERKQQLHLDPSRGRLHFVAKEAVYKAVYPIDPTFLDHHDIEIDLAGRKATTRTGHLVEIRTCAASHLAVLAFIRP